MRFGVGVVLFIMVKLPSLVGVISIGIRIWIVNTRLETNRVLAVAVLVFGSIIRGSSSNCQPLHYLPCSVVVGNRKSVIHYVTALA